MKIDLRPVKPRALAVRTIPEAAPDLAASLGLPADRRALGIITATSDDALFSALDQGTKASPADVVYAKSFYAGAAHPSGPLSGECIGIYAAPRSRRDRRRADAPASPTSRTRPGSTPSPSGGAGEDVVFYPHVIASTGRYLAPLAGRGRRRADGLPDRAAAGVDRRPRRRVQGGERAPGEVVRPAVGDQLRRRLPGRRSDRRARRRRRAFASAIADVCAAPRAARRRAAAAKAIARRDGARQRGARRGTAAPATRRRPLQALATGERFAIKPDHLTHLVDDASLVVKTHPRIVLRGKIDFLQSAILDAQVAADAGQARARWSASWASCSSWRARWSAPR